SPRLKARLDCALALYRQHLVPRILVSGGVEPGGIDEATVMAKYLSDSGVPKEHILIDSLGNNSMATAVNTAAIVRAQHLQKVTIVSQYFHIPRCELAFRKAGLRNFSAAYPRHFELLDLYAIAREGAALPVYYLRY